MAAAPPHTIPCVATYTHSCTTIHWIWRDSGAHVQAVVAILVIVLFLAGWCSLRLRIKQLEEM